jgi:thiamine-phosphate pyrophosphorylase
MISKKSLLKKSQLYLILDRQKFRRFSLKKIKSLASEKTIGLLQLRDKHSAKAKVLSFALKLAKLLDQAKTLLIAHASGASGVHLGQGDFSLGQARKILGKDKIIGISCHNLTQALKAQAAGADYLGIGPVYKTVTKPGCRGIGLKTFAHLKSKIKIPYFAIGNIGPGNIDEVSLAGVKRIAVCRAILEADNPELAAQRLYKKLKKL